MGFAVFIRRSLGLFSLQNDLPPDDQDIHLRCHETTVGVFGRTDDWLAAHIETGIDQYQFQCAQRANRLYARRRLPLFHGNGDGCLGRRAASRFED